MYILAGLLLLGLVLNWLIRPLPESVAMPASRVNGAARPAAVGNGEDVGSGSHPLLITAAWAAVWIPILWGVWMTLQKAVLLFRH
jgi:hypothetical protein